MRTNIDIDDRLLRRARKLTRLRTKRAIVQRALEVLVERESQRGSWDDFFELHRKTPPLPPEFMADRQDEFPQDRELFP